MEQQSRFVYLVTNLKKHLYKQNENIIFEFYLRKLLEFLFKIYLSNR